MCRRHREYGPALACSFSLAARLALFRGYCPDCCGEAGMRFCVHRPILYGRTCRIFAQMVVIFPVHGGSYGPRHKPAATVGTDIAQNVIDAGSAKRTFIGTNACFKRMGRQETVAVLAAGPEFKHDDSVFSCFPGPAPFRRQSST